MDSKFRFMFPVSLRKQLGELFDKGFVVNRNLHQKCLTLYTVDEWARQNKKLGKLNRFVKSNDILIRKITGGATQVEADNTGRILLPRTLAEHADIKTDVKILGSNNVIEIWDKKAYDDFMAQDLNIEKLAEDVFGNTDFNTDDE
ncbi:MAG: division/cell wall cluster transcriptional repressor MraZ [Bacteroidia bacterium]|nr:division/cell wall cluster transcriptional repressor MraZ [Bacteroidia bacterium]